MHILGSSFLAVPPVVAAVLLGLASTPVSALASPGPQPLPFQNADYDARLMPANPRAIHPRSHDLVRAFDQNETAHSDHHELHPSSEASSSMSAHKAHKTEFVSKPPTARFFRRQLTSLDGLLSGMQGFSSGSQSDSQDLRKSIRRLGPCISLTTL